MLRRVKCLSKAHTPRVSLGSKVQLDSTPAGCSAAQHRPLPSEIGLVGGGRKKKEHKHMDAETLED